MSNVFKLAVRRGYIDRNPCQGIDFNTTNKREVFLTDEQYNLVKSNVADWIQCAMDISMLTGCRKCDTVKIMLSDITDEGLLIQQQKTGHKQLFLWNDELRKVIDRAKQLDRPIRSFYLLGSKRGQPYSERSIDNAFRRAKDKLGLGDIQVRDIRAKAATEAKDNGQDYQSLLGHSTKAMSDRYIKNRKAVKVEPLQKVL
jgi:integrase